MSDILAYFLTWTTYGTWLPGDGRGWANRHENKWSAVRSRRPPLEAYARNMLKEDPIIMDVAMREVVCTAIEGACVGLDWRIHALAVCSNHVHIVVTANDANPGKVLGVLKVAGTRALNEWGKGVTRRRWWTKMGSKRVLNAVQAVDAAVRYVCDHNLASGGESSSP